MRRTLSRLLGRLRRRASTWAADQAPTDPAWSPRGYECDVCGLPDHYRGQGDGIGSCDCARCGCGSAKTSQFCICDDYDDYEEDGWDDREPSRAAMARTPVI